MAWNNGKETKIFEAQQRKLRVIYLANGMTEEQIEALYQFDLKEFNARRREAEHTQRLDFDSIDFDDKETDNPLFEKFLEVLSVTDEYMSEDRFGWVEEIENPKIVKAINKLSAEQKELLTQWVIDDLTQEQMAENFGVRQGTISKRIEALKKFFKEFLKNGIF